MTMRIKLDILNKDIPDSQIAAIHSIQAIANDEMGIISIDSATARAIILLLKGQTLSTGQVITRDPQDKQKLNPFGPSLLPSQVQDKVRALLAGSVNGDAALRMFNEMICRGLKIAIDGWDPDGSYIQGTIIAATAEDFICSNPTMKKIIKTLRLECKYNTDGNGSARFTKFARAVNKYGAKTEMCSSLTNLVAYGNAVGAADVNWDDVALEGY